VATLGRNPTVALLGFFTARKYAQDMFGPNHVFDQVYLLPESQVVKDSDAVTLLVDSFKRFGRLSVTVLDAPSGFPETADGLRQLPIKLDSAVFLNYTGGRKYLSLGALKHASENGWYGFSLNPYDRLGFSAVFQCGPEGFASERFAVDPLPLNLLLELNGIEILQQPSAEQLTWLQSKGGSTGSWVLVENHHYAVFQDRERVFVCDPTPIPSADKKPEYVRRQNHARQIGDLLAVSVYCALEENEVTDYDGYKWALETEALNNGVVFDSNFEKTIIKFRERQFLSETQPQAPKPPLHSGRVLIVLVSDQPMNAYAPILMHQPGQVYLLTTPEKSYVATNIQKALASDDRDIQICSWLDSSNPITTATVIEQIITQCDGLEVILNVSGLTTPMSAAAFLAALKYKIAIEYLDWNYMLKLSGERIKVNWRDRSQEPLQQMQTVFLLHGFEFSPQFKTGAPVIDLPTYSASESKQHHRASSV
jgi:CRISPR-associated protein (Cas_Cas02710)